MNIKELQAALNVHKERAKKPALVVDGIAGRRTMEFVDSLLSKEKTEHWSDARRLIGAEQFIIQEMGIFIGDIDGLVGEQTRYGRSVYAARKAGDKDVETWRDKDFDNSPTPPAAPAPLHKWPRQKDVASFFGDRGESQALLLMPFPMRLAWAPETTIYRYSCHKLVHDPMKRIWQRTLAHYTYPALKDLRLDMFGGCLNVRKMRGGSAWSMHSWGIAVDVDPDRNQLKFKREAASLDDPVYKPFWGFVYDEGFISLGIELNYDWMHFQAARL